MLRVGGANSQELHHSSLCDISHIYQRLNVRFYLMNSNTENRVRIDLTISRDVSGNAVARLIVTTGYLHTFLGYE
jgi:RNase P protein component